MTSTRLCNFTLFCKGKNSCSMMSSVISCNTTVNRLFHWTRLHKSLVAGRPVHPGILKFKTVTYTLNTESQRSYAQQDTDKALGELVYTGRVGSLMRKLKIFSLTTSTIGLCLQPYLFLQLQDVPLTLTMPVFTVINMFVFLNPFLIHFIAKKYVVELYFNQQSNIFTAVMLTFFAKKEKFTFTANEVKVPDVPNMFAMLSAKERPLFVNDSDFTDLNVYKHLMGFDKPLDLTNIKKD